MNRRNIVVAAGALGVLAFAGWGGAHLVASGHARGLDAPVSREGLALQSRALDRSITLFQQRVGTDPYSSTDLGMLSGLFLQRARQTGDYQDVLRAEEAARRSLTLRPEHNLRADATLAASLLDQHRFREALASAQALVREQPGSATFRAMLGEIQLELGMYDSAAGTFGSLETSRNDLDVAPRLARWQEIEGHTAAARELLYAARDQALVRHGLLPEQRAWFHLRVGDLELRNGELDAAEDAFRAGLAISPGDYRLQAAMARLEAARGDWAGATGYGERVLGTVPDPATLALLSDVSAAAGDSAQAREYAKAVEVSLMANPGTFHRADGLFLLDHGLRRAEVLRQAGEDVKSRKDIYGYDLLAWALHRAGRDAEAAVAMKQALRTGSEDALLLYHAGMIESALGRRDAAREHLERALEVNPAFSVTQAPLARAALDSLRGGWFSRLLPHG
ncbi:MAG: tetratricopeptide repeat protein [Gemmatimonadetes bacterium]|nr:tetratricopeptide repeat protein [Gemmatimonadota bacterium]